MFTSDGELDLRSKLQVGELFAYILIVFASWWLFRDLWVYVFFDLVCL